MREKNVVNYIVANRFAVYTFYVKQQNWINNQDVWEKHMA